MKFVDEEAFLDLSAGRGVYLGEIMSAHPFSAGNKNTCLEDDATRQKNSRLMEVNQDRRPKSSLNMGQAAFQDPKDWVTCRATGASQG